jgi:FkbM family methyltransferase
MVSMIKKYIKKIFNLFQLDIVRYNKEFINLSFDKIIVNILDQNPIIFDVGANEGQSIKKYLDLFKNPTIHSFEPLVDEFQKMQDQFGYYKNIILNNYALGNIEETKIFYKAKKSSISSFNKFNFNSLWFKLRSKQNNTSIENFSSAIDGVKISTLDDYCKNNKINKINLLKIDTQGYEDKILEGAMNLINNNKIDIIICEIMFDNAYEKYFSFSDIEKYLITKNFRMVGIDLINNNLFSGVVFFADVMYINNKNFDINKINIVK